MNGAPSDNHQKLADYHAWLEETELPKLMFHSSEGALLKGESLKWCHGLALTLSHPFGTICYGKQP